MKNQAFPSVCKRCFCFYSVSVCCSVCAETMAWADRVEDDSTLDIDATMSTPSMEMIEDLRSVVR